MPNFGSRLKSVIRSSGYYQYEVAEAVGVSEPTMSLYVNDKALPPSEILLRICTKLRCSSDWLLGLEVTPLNTHEHSGIEWVEHLPENITPFQKEAIGLGIGVFSALVVENLDADTLIAPNGRFPNQNWATLHQAFMIAIQAKALRITKVSRNFELEDAVKACFGKQGISLKNVIVANYLSGKTTYSLASAMLGVELVAFLAANEALVGSRLIGKVVGIGGGYTLRRVAEQSIPTLNEFVGTEWIPLHAVEDPSLDNPELSAYFITATLASYHRGSRVLPFPFVPPEKREQLQLGRTSQLPTERCAAEALSKLQNASSVFYTVSGTNLGYPATSPGLAPKLLQEMYRDLEQRGLLGEFGGSILGWMLNDGGEPIGSNEIQKIIFTPRLDTLMRIASFGDAWLLAAKGYKGRAVRMAIRNGFANSLVIDSEIAHYLIDNTS